ncbi:unnamed protein product [Brachionus calyciflorus]|uniref:Uncharacterized protein n=1 Tax=Brachionus calyciflorus TaxID=104777 RepID=A0A814H982_9BILA|nr:unnamed protein product [Brachionus calyciflorus]
MPTKSFNSEGKFVNLEKITEKTYFNNIVEDSDLLGQEEIHEKNYCNNFNVLNFNEPSKNKENMDINLNNVYNGFLGGFFKDYIYDGNEIDVKDFYMAVYSLKSKNSLNNKTIDDICLKCYLSLKDKNYEVYFCCVNCKVLSGQNLTIDSLITKKNICEKSSKEISPFVTFDIYSQIDFIFNNINLFNQLISKQLLIGQSNNLSDITDGSIYQNFIKNTQDKYISLVLDTDGAQVTNSKILCVWLGKEKPVYDIFVKNMVRDLILSKNKTIKIKNFDFTIKVQSVIMDLPAKAAVLNVKQFNGEFCCIYCYHPGEHSFMNGKRIYPPKKFENRTDVEFKNMVNLVTETKKPIFGIKGPDSLIYIIDLPSQAPLDYMHLVLQGHLKWLIKQFFFSDKGNEFYIGE